VEYVIYKLGKRLNSNNWLVALKALMVFHRLMRECDPGFQEQVRPECNSSRRKGKGSALQQQQPQQQQQHKALDEEEEQAEKGHSRAAVQSKTEGSSSRLKASTP
jgi:RecB family exonuclease